MGADGLGLRSGCDEMSELRRDALERDEKRLAELGRRTVEMYALAHIFTERLEVWTHGRPDWRLLACLICSSCALLGQALPKHGHEACQLNTGPATHYLVASGCMGLSCCAT